MLANLACSQFSAWLLKGESMKKTNKKAWKCPECKKSVKEYPAISRKDNKTEICSQCGFDEAMAQFFLQRMETV